MWLRRILRTIGYSSFLAVLAGIICALVIEDYSTQYLSYSFENFPKCHSALVLGTSSHIGSGRSNPYFNHRIEAAKELFKVGKINKLIVSGDNRVSDYNEPEAMKNALIACGVPDSCIVLDYAGLRTLDSMVRCKEVFGQDSVIVVSQRFHNARAVYIARKNGLVAFGFNTKDVKSNVFKMAVREFFSRVKCILDIYILHTRPRHLGPSIEI